MCVWTHEESHSHRHTIELLSVFYLKRRTRRKRWRRRRIKQRQQQNKQERTASMPLKTKTVAPRFRYERSDFQYLVDIFYIDRMDSDIVIYYAISMCIYLNTNVLNIICLKVIPWVHECSQKKSCYWETEKRSEKGVLRSLEAVPGAQVTDSKNGAMPRMAFDVDK